MQQIACIIALKVPAVKMYATAPAILNGSQAILLDAFFGGLTKLLLPAGQGSLLPAAR
jgi:hypothetical protein